MQVQVSGHHLDVGDALRSHVADRLDASVGKYFDKPIDGHVTLTKEGYEVKADCAVHLNSGMRINTQGRAADPYIAFDEAVERLEKRLRRYKRRLKSHANGNKPELPAESFPSFVLDAGDEHEEVADDAQPIIIAEGTTSVPRLSVVDAVMHMDLGNSKFVVFRNGATGGLNLVYRREDGHIGWIDASRDSQKS
jgi:ribosomal subunit interface protein